MAREIHGTAHGNKRNFLEAASSLGPIWLQGFQHESGSGKVEVCFSKHRGDVPEADLFFLADTFNLDLSSKELHESNWINYYFK